MMNSSYTAVIKREELMETLKVALEETVKTNGELYAINSNR